MNNKIAPNVAFKMFNTVSSDSGSGYFVGNILSSNNKEPFSCTNK